MRKPDVTIGGAGNPYLLRWWVIPRNRFFNIYLHKFLRSDDDRALHDHPWLFNISILLKGEYDEVTYQDDNVLISKEYKAGHIKFRWGKYPHRIILHGYYECISKSPLKKIEWPVWTLFITGPVVRKWGFYCPKGWRVWHEFLSVTEGGNTIGRGCE